MVIFSKVIRSVHAKTSPFLFMGFICFFLNLFSSPTFLQAFQPHEETSLARYSLDGIWQFRQGGRDKWHKATVPGCVHTDLMRNGLIPDPYFRKNETEVQWIENEDWEYKREFELSREITKKSHIELVCQGLDTYANIWVNGQKIAETENMFRGYRWDIKLFLREGKNEISIHFESPVKKAKVLEGRLPYKLPGGSPHTRKAPYHFGWDWGPRLVTCGIWRPLFIEAWEDIRINELNIVQEFPASNKVIVHAKLSILSDREEKVKVEAKISGKRKFDTIQSADLSQGETIQKISLEIPDPDLWWPAGMGKQNLYNVTVQVFKGNRVLDSAIKRIGIRKLSLEQKDDQWGRSFRFVVNDVPFFAKGGNWIPADMFPTRVSPQKYKELLKSCVEANMNMIRVWGGGIYEAPEFYNLCDELGLTVWQDFMFACAMYPGDDNFLENVKKEAEYVIKELRHHPSLVLWCGNNECEEGWFHWGWKNQYPPKVWNDYEKVFHKILPQAVEKWDPSRAYWPSSPHSQKVGEPRSQESGDMHYWGIWHGKEPFSEYRKKFHRFQSEFGFQSFPLIETVKTFTLPEDWNLTSPVMEHHQKHSEGNKLILQYMLDNYRLPQDFDSLLWLSQVLQAEGMKIAVEHFRSQMPRVMGALYWQINDCWQVASWAGMDYFGIWKALHYYAKRFFSSVLIAPIDKDKLLNVYCISDLFRPVDAEFRYAVYSYEGEIVTQEAFQIKIEPRQSRIVFSKPLEDLKRDFSDEEVYFSCELVQGDKTLSSNVFHFSVLKRISLPEPQIEKQISFKYNKISIELISKQLAKDVYLSVSGCKGRFSDNFFDMIPGRVYRVKFLSTEKINENQFKKAFGLRTLRDTY